MPSYKAIITNTLDQTIKAFYRMPKKVEGKKSPAIEVEILPRALCQSIYFPSEECYKEWKHQNEYLFTNNYLLEGEKVNEKQAIHTNSENTKRDNEVNKGTVDRQVDIIQEAAENVNSKVEFEEISVEEDKKRNRKNKNK